MSELDDAEDRTAALVDSLRAEISDEDEVGDSQDTVLPEPLRRLFLAAPVRITVAQAIDDLLVDEDVVNDDMYSRLMQVVRADAERRAALPKYLEQMVLTTRAERSMTIEELAEIVQAEPEVLSSIESAFVRFDNLTEEQVASWVDALDLELEVATAALELSLAKPAVAYLGEAPRGRDHARSFANRVRDIVSARRQGR